MIQILLVILLGSFPPLQQPATTCFHNLNTPFIYFWAYFAVLSLYWTSCFFLTFFMSLKIVPSLLCHLLPVISFQPFFFLFLVIFEKSLYDCFKEQGNLVSSVTYIFHCCKHHCWGCWSPQIFGAIEKQSLEAISQSRKNICETLFKIWRFVNVYIRKDFEEKE